jgi:DNA helicase HerA-like ATPase
MNISLGKDFITGQDFSIDPARHALVEGSSGVGKSSLLLNLCVAAIRNRIGLLVIDPHGDLADQLAGLVPKTAARDFIWIDPDADSVPPFNPLFSKTGEELELGKESLFTTFKSLAGTAWGDESARIIINAIDAVCEAYANPTPVHIYRFMADDKFREKVLRKSASPFLKMFREQYDEKLRDSEQMSKFSPPLNKVSKLLRPSILPIIGQAGSLDWLDIMNKRRIVIVRASKGRLGEEIAQILGSLIISMVSIAALKRERQRTRPLFMAVVDEVHNFTHGGRFNTILAEGRKFGLSLVCGTQGLYQLPFAKDLLSNCATQICFNAAGEDAQLMAKNWGERCELEILGLPRYQFMARTFKNDVPSVQTVYSNPPVQRRGDEANPTKLIKTSLERWSVDKRQVNAKVARFLTT